MPNTGILSRIQTGIKCEFFFSPIVLNQIINVSLLVYLTIEDVTGRCRL